MIDELVIRALISGLTQSALCGDWSTETEPSVLRTMGRDSAKALDVPVAMEMVALLQHFGATLPVRCAALGGEASVNLLAGVVWDNSERILLLLEVAANTLGDTAHWISDALPSDTIRALPGVLALPFTVEHQGVGSDAKPVLFPDWFCVYYPHASGAHAFPILALKSVMRHDAFGGDWVNAAVGRMAHYSLPRAQAEDFVSRGVRAR